jgi:hypothetical protein
MGRKGALRCPQARAGAENAGRAWQCAMRTPTVGWRLWMLTSVAASGAPAAWVQCCWCARALMAAPAWHPRHGHQAVPRTHVTLYVGFDRGALHVGATGNQVRRGGAPHCQEQPSVGMAGPLKGLLLGTRCETSTCGALRWQPGCECVSDQHFSLTPSSSSPAVLLSTARPCVRATSSAHHCQRVKRRRSASTLHGTGLQLMVFPGPWSRPSCWAQTAIQQC